MGGGSNEDHVRNQHLYIAHAVKRDRAAPFQIEGQAIAMLL
jgi:hypothetical protein